MASPLCRPIGLPDSKDSGLQTEDSECLGVPKGDVLVPQNRAQ